MKGKRKSINVFVADKCGKISEGVGSILQKTSNISLVGVAKEGKDVLESARKTELDLLIVDFNIKCTGGVDTSMRMLEEFPGVKILAVATHPNIELMSKAFKAGAHGILYHGCTSEKLTDAIYAVMREEVYVCTRMIGCMVDAYIVPGIDDQVMPSDLSMRQMEVLKLLVEGNTTQSIAEELSVSVKTVESHRRELMKKLEIFCVSGLTKYALRHGLTSLKD